MSEPEVEIAVITALGIEYDAIRAVIDPQIKDHFDLDLFYKLGSLSGHTIAVVGPEGAGAGHVALAANHLARRWKQLKLILVVGICACVGKPEKGAEIFLGDVIFSKSITDYSLGKLTQGGMKFEDHCRTVASYHSKRVNQILNSLSLSNFDGRDMMKRLNENLAYQEVERPEKRYDRLFESTYHHTHRGDSLECGCHPFSGESCSSAQGASCDQLGCSEDKTEKGREVDTGVSFHVGAYASGPNVLKNAEIRNRLAKDFNVIAIEMEGYGLWDVSTPAVMIKSACDYADSHKNNHYHKFAAATAACAAKVFVEIYLGVSIESTAPSTQSPDDLSIPRTQMFLDNITIEPGLSSEAKDAAAISTTAQYIKAPPRVHRTFSNWHECTTGKNLIFWGKDHGWLKKALHTYSHTLAEHGNGVVYIDCKELGNNMMSFDSRIIAAICSRCHFANTSCHTISELQGLGVDAIAKLDAGLVGILVVIIYDLDYRSDESSSDDLKMHFIEALMEANNFKVLLASNWKPLPGKHWLSRTNHQNIGQFSRCQELKLF